ncbi:MAG: PDZ domain-containing protein [Planctomycetaceae bacterium]|nr:PDZ domain-containing protein [Planctomycetaceae bacterium]
MNQTWQRVRSWRRWMLSAAIVAMVGECSFAQEGGAAAVVITSSSGVASPYWLGVHVEPLDDATREKLKLAEKRGVLVATIFPDSPAAKAGVQVGDVILLANNIVTDSLDSLVVAVQAAGDKELRLKVLRNGAEQTLTARPTRRPETQMQILTGEQANLHRLFPQGLPNLPGASIRIEAQPFGALNISPLPKDVEISISQQGDSPTKLRIRRGDKTHEVTLDKLNELPPEVRAQAQSFVMQLPLRLQVVSIKTPKFELPLPPNPTLKAVPKPQRQPEAKAESKPNATPKPEAQPRAKSPEKPALPPKPEPAATSPAATAGVERMLKDQLLPQLDRLANQVEKLATRVETLERRSAEPPANPTTKKKANRKPKTAPPSNASSDGQ